MVLGSPRLALAVVVALAAFAVGGATLASGSTYTSKGSASVTITTAKVGKLGVVLVTATGRVLYMFQPDKHEKVACDSSCQSFWPPLVAPKRGDAKATGKAKQKLIGSYKNPFDGKRIVTYNGWPLYTYVSDPGPHRALGQNLDLNGGYWWVLTPNGKPER